jgi:hypothetical protein
LKHNHRISFIICFSALIISYYVTLRVDAPSFDDKYKRHTGIISNNIEYPYKYRLINPYLTQVYISVLKIAIPEKFAFLSAYAVQNILIFLFLFFAVAKFLSVWFDEVGIILGLLIFAVIVPLSLTGYDVLGDMTTAGLMALGFYFINTNKIKYLYPLVFIGAFNEFQIILLVPFYFFGTKNNFSIWKIWRTGSLLVVTIIIGYLIIYLLRGGSAGREDVVWYFTKDASYNISHPGFVLQWVIMIVPLLYYALKGIKTKPDFLKRNLYSTLPLFYIFVFFFMARMREIDKALTIFIILIPLALYSLIPDHVTSQKSES